MSLALKLDHARQDLEYWQKWRKTRNSVPRQQRQRVTICGPTGRLVSYEMLPTCQAGSRRGVYARGLSCGNTQRKANTSGKALDQGSAQRKAA